MKNTVHYFILSIVVLVIYILLQQFDIHYPHPSQAESLKLLSILPVLVLGHAGAYIWDKYVMINNQPVISWKYVKFIAYGAIVGILLVFMVAIMGFSKLMSLKLGISSLHLDFPFSIFVYTVASILVESIYHLIPIGILFWIVSHLILKGKKAKYTYWTLAVIFSLLEPISQLVAFEMFSISLLFIGLLIFSFNLLLCFLLLRYGILAAIVTRWSFYMVWHVVIGPMFVYN